MPQNISYNNPKANQTLSQASSASMESALTHLNPEIGQEELTK